MQTKFVRSKFIFSSSIPLRSLVHSQENSYFLRLSLSLWRNSRNDQTKKFRRRFFFFVLHRSRHSAPSRFYYCYENSFISFEFNRVHIHPNKRTFVDLFQQKNPFLFYISFFSSSKTNERTNERNEHCFDSLIQSVRSFISLVSPCRITLALRSIWSIGRWVLMVRTILLSLTFPSLSLQAVQHHPQ